MIPTFRPVFYKEDKDAIGIVLDSQWCGMGEYVKRFENAFIPFSKKQHNIATNSCTLALYFASRCMFEKGDAVGVPAISYVSTASAPALAGCNIVFIDVSGDDLLMNRDDLIVKAERYKLKGVIPVHLFGNKCDYLGDVIDKYGLKVIEDCAHTPTSCYKDSIACFSFESKKPITTVNGGMLSTDDRNIAERARILRFNGCNSDTSHRSGRCWDYDVIEHGFTGELDDLRAVLGLNGLKRYDDNLGIRKRNISLFDSAIDFIGSRLSSIKHSIESSHFMYIVKTNDRDGFLNYMYERNIRCGVHYKPLFLHSVFGGTDHECPNALSEWIRLATIPNLVDFTSDEVRNICNSLREYR